MPSPIANSDASLDGKVWIYTDGSFTRCDDDHETDRCGWGFCVLPSSGGRVVDVCGPVDLEGPLAPMQRSRLLSNNAAELCAILHCLCWVSHSRDLISQLT